MANRAATVENPGDGGGIEFPDAGIYEGRGLRGGTEPDRGDPEILRAFAPRIKHHEAFVRQGRSDFPGRIPDAQPAVGAAPKRAAAAVDLKLEDAAALEGPRRLGEVSRNSGFGRDVLEDDERVGKIERAARDHFESAGRDVQIHVGRAREMEPALLDHRRRDVDTPDHARAGRERPQQTADAAADFQHGGGRVEFDVAQDHLSEIVFAGGPKQGVGGGVAAADVAFGVEAGAGLPFPLHASGGLPPAGHQTTPNTRTANGMFHTGSIAAHIKNVGPDKVTPELVTACSRGRKHAEL